MTLNDGERPATSSLPWRARPGKELLRLSVPLVVSFLSASAMTVVDTLFIGRLGPLALAGAGLGGVTVFAVASFGIALFGAARVRVGEAVGRGNHEEARANLGDFLRLGAILGALNLVIGVLLAALLPLLAPGDPSGELGRTFAFVRSFGLPFVMLSTAVAQWRQALGDSASTMRAAVIANIVNVPLNWLFVFSLGWGVGGAALATVCAQLVEFGLLFARQQEDGFHLALGSTHGARAAFLRGLPTGAERVLDMIAFALVPILLIQVGPVAVAAHQITLQVMLMSFLPLAAFADAVCILVAQARGANAEQLVSPLVRRGLAFALGYALIGGALGFLFAETIVRWFNEDPALVDEAARTLRVGAVLQVINGVYLLQKGILRGYGDFRFVASVTVICAWIFTPPLTWLFGVLLGHGAPGAWAAIIVEVVVGVSILAARTARVRVRLGPAATGFTPRRAT